MRVLNSLTGLVLRVWFAAEFARFISQQPRPDLARPVTIDGVRPVRVLITGAGLGVGYGTRTAEDALPGQLAAALQARLHRGVHVDTQVEIARPVGSTARHLAEQTPLDYDLIVHTPGFGEAHRGHTARSIRHLRALIDAARTSEGDIPLVLTGLPAPRVKRPIERIALQRATRVDAVIRGAATSPLTAFAAAPSYATPSTYWIFDHEYYRQFAAAVAAVSTPFLTRAGTADPSAASTL
jgi:hypothetical protein